MASSLMAKPPPATKPDPPGTLSVSAKSAILIDATSGKVLWSKDPDTARYPASTTKIMTALLLLEHTQPTDMIIAPPDVETIPESSMHLKPGEVVSAHDMLYAIMLRSANDGCYAIAVHIAGSVEAFSKMMNERAKELGCKNTNFHNPHGLNDKAHLVSARALALIAREAMNHPEFREVVRTHKYQITRSVNQEDLWMVSKNKWILKDATADGIKTGWTVPAGKCYVGSATRNGFRVITAILKSEDWQADHKKMLDWAYAQYKIDLKLNDTNALVNALVINGVAPTVPVKAIKPTLALVRKSRPSATVTYEWLNSNAPLFAGTPIGNVVIRDAEGFSQRIKLVTMNDVPANPPPKVSLAGMRGFPGFAIGAGLLGGVFWMRRRARSFQF